MKLKHLILLATVLFASNFAFASFPVKYKSDKSAIPAVQMVNANVSYYSTVSVAELANPEMPLAPSGSGKSQLVALLLCIFLGGLGIHRFYLGYTWQGVVQLLTAGGCGIWALIDLIRIITGDLKPKNGNYTDTL